MEHSADAGAGSTDGASGDMHASFVEPVVSAFGSNCVVLAGSSCVVIVGATFGSTYCVVIAGYSFGTTFCVVIVGATFSSINICCSLDCWVASTELDGAVEGS